MFFNYLLYPYSVYSCLYCIMFRVHKAYKPFTVEIRKDCTCAVRKILFQHRNDVPWIHPPISLSFTNASQCPMSVKTSDVEDASKILTFWRTGLFKDLSERVIWVIILYSHTIHSFIYLSLNQNLIILLEHLILHLSNFIKLLIIVLY